MLQGCVQPSMMPNIDRGRGARARCGGHPDRVCGAAPAAAAPCARISAISQGGLDDMRRNIDAWMPLVAAGEVEAIVTSASACSLAIKEYGHALSGDAAVCREGARASARWRAI